MTRIAVFPFEVWDAVEGKNVTKTRLSTRGFIDRANGEAILASMKMADESLVDGHGRVVLDPTTDSAKYLKKLNAEGEGEALSRHNGQAMAALVMAGLVTATISGRGRTTYAMTERGWQYVRDLL
jgi:hypothetical protein